MNTCKDCQFRKRPGNKILCFLNPPEMHPRDGSSIAVRPVIEDSDPACSHFKRGEGSPGSITLLRCKNGDIEIPGFFDDNDALFTKMQQQLKISESRTFRLEPVEDGS